MNTLEVVYDDGGRSKYYKASSVGDCVTRAIAIAANMDYKEVYQMIIDITHRKGRHKTKYNSHPRNGVLKKDIIIAMEKIGFTWHPCMSIGTGCKVHLAKDEIPMDKTIICNLSKHLVAVINGVIHDIYDPSKEGKRCVYGYWEKTA